MQVFCFNNLEIYFAVGIYHLWTFQNLIISLQLKQILTYLQTNFYLVGRPKNVGETIDNSQLLRTKAVPVFQ